jgi:hypothetical protein
MVPAPIFQIRQPPMLQTPGALLIDSGLEIMYNDNNRTVGGFWEDNTIQVYQGLSSTAGNHS